MDEKIESMWKDHIDKHPDRVEYNLVPLVLEGAPMHPDSLWGDMSDKYYFNQLQAYADAHGLDEAKRVYCTRPELLEKLTEKE